MNFIKFFPKKYFIVVIFGLLVLFFLFLKYVIPHFKAENPNEVYSSVENVNSESCLNCHQQSEGFSKYHNPKQIGCISCHLGNPNAQEKLSSHKGMVLIPGNLADAKETCGKCHPDELAKINTSLMTTNSGLVAVDKFIFGEASTPNGHYHIKDIKNTPADKHLRDLCANCHLGAEKETFGEITQLSRGGGCNACHLNYSEEALTDLNKYTESNKKELPSFHPSTTVFVTDTHCFGCHSRSSRISTNYQGWQETLLNKEDVQGKDAYKVFEDERVYSYQGEDVHHNKGMLCIDCHSSHEVMGDGSVYTHEEEAVSLQCADCHFKEKPNTIAYSELDKESLLVFLHRDYNHQDKKILIASKDKHPLVNTYVDENNNAFLIGKKDGELHKIKPQSEVCSRDNAHQNLNCSSCHSSWAPRCIGCHNQYDGEEMRAFDLLDKKYGKGQWKEYVAEFSSSQPSLGVRIKNGKKVIEPAIPGMIMTIDKGSYKGEPGKDVSFHRLYAPNSPHTTTKSVRDCKSCHLNPATIGYGNGKLEYNIKDKKGSFKFTAEYDVNSNDNLPEDAWIPFLKSEDAAIVKSTRTNFRPFTVKEQQQILLIGACLQCHKEDSKVMQQSLIEGINPLLKRLDKSCILPTWK